MARQSETGLRSGAWWMAGAAVVLVAALLRILAAGTDLWLDEVWSLSIAQTVSGPFDVFVGIRQTNNHALNTLWLAMVGETASPYVMRLLSVVFGAGSVVLAGYLASRKSRYEGLIAMVLVGGSYLMVDASSEARGYAPMVFFFLLAWIALEKAEAPGAVNGRPWVVVFILSVVIGTLFQLSFVIAYAALAAGWFVRRLQSSGNTSAGWLREGLRWHAVPLLVYGALYLAWVRHVDIGGEALPTSFILERTAMLAVGIEGHELALRLGVGVAAIVMFFGLAVSVRRDLSRTAIYIAGIIVAPAFLLWWLEPSFLAPRYFGASIVLFLLLGSGLLGALAERGRAGSALVCLLLLGFLTANLRTMAPLFFAGRGDFAEALQIMDRESRAGPLEIGLRSYFRHGLLLEHNARRVVPNRELRLVGGDRWPARGPEWFIVAPRGPAETFAEQTRGPRGNFYDRVASFEGVQGREPPWFLYRAARGPGAHFSR